MVRLLNGKFFSILEASSVCSNLVPSLNRSEHCFSLLVRHYENCDLDDASEGIPRRLVFFLSDVSCYLQTPNQN